MTITHVYVYQTGERPDGMDYALGVVYAGRPVDGMYALFRDRDAAAISAEALAKHHDAQLMLLPSAVTE